MIMPSIKSPQNRYSPIDIIKIQDSISSMIKFRSLLASIKPTVNSRLEPSLIEQYSKPHSLIQSSSHSNIKKK